MTARPARATPARGLFTLAQAAVQAREIRALLDEDTPTPAKRAAGPSGKRTAAAAKAPEQT